MISSVRLSCTRGRGGGKKIGAVYYVLCTHIWFLEVELYKREGRAGKRSKEELALFLKQQLTVQAQAHRLDKQNQI